MTPFSTATTRSQDVASPSAEPAESPHTLFPDSDGEPMAANTLQRKPNVSKRSNSNNGRLSSNNRRGSRNGG